MRIFFSNLLKGSRDVGFLEIVAFVEQWFTAGLGQGVGEAVPIIEAGGVPSLAKVGISLPGGVSLLFSYRFDGDARAAEESVERAGAGMFGLGLDDEWQPRRKWRRRGGRSRPRQWLWRKAPRRAR